MSLPTNKCKTNQFCSNGQLFIQFSDVFRYNLFVSYKIPGKYNCQSRNVVYVLTCGIHNMQYVGETKQTLNARFRLHESMINTKKENPVADHFNVVF